MIDSPLTRKIIRLAIEEDLSYGDITSNLTINGDRAASASILAKEECIICGTPLIAMIFQELGWDVEIKLLVVEGKKVKQGAVVAKLSGDVKHLLSAERTILNFLQRLSGVATATHEMVAAAGTITVLDTRKTMPGWRVLEKYAVRVGGGKNHRAHLGDMILVKNNHIDANGGDPVATLRKVAAGKPPYMPLEVEVRNVKELKAVLPFNPDVVMLDNMEDNQIKEALRIINEVTQPPCVEVSGGITKARLARLQRLGVRYVSSGALTTKAVNVDIAMRIVNSK